MAAMACLGVIVLSLLAGLSSSTELTADAACQAAYDNLFTLRWGADRGGSHVCMGNATTCPSSCQTSIYAVDAACAGKNLELDSTQVGITTVMAYSSIDIYSPYVLTVESSGECRDGTIYDEGLARAAAGSCAEAHAFAKPALMGNFWGQYCSQLSKTTCHAKCQQAIDAVFDRCNAGDRTDLHVNDDSAWDPAGFTASSTYGPRTCRYEAASGGNGAQSGSTGGATSGSSSGSTSGATTTLAPTTAAPTTAAPVQRRGIVAMDVTLPSGQTAEQFVADASVKAGIEAGIARKVGGNVLAAWVHATLTLAGGGRRLGDSRRLSTANINVDYTITIPPGTTVDASSLDLSAGTAQEQTEWATELKSSMEAATSNTYTVAVTSVEAVTTTAVTTTAIPTTTQEDSVPTSSAFRNSAKSLVVMVVVAMVIG